MTLNVMGVLRDAWAMAKRDRDVLIALAGLLIFVPQYGLLLFLGPQPEFPGFEADAAALKLYNDASTLWMTTYGPGVLLAAFLVVIGQIAITALYVDRSRPDVMTALRRAPLLFFPALLVVTIASPLGLSLQTVPLLILPAAYLEGRLLLTMPILLGERPTSALRAVAASWRRTAGHGLVAAGLACFTVVGGRAVALLFLALGEVWGRAPMQNPFVMALIDGGAALGATLGAVATFLVQVALYRRLSKGT